MTLAALLTLALGIGANTVIFTAVEGVLLHPLPYRDADRILAAFVYGVGVRDPGIFAAVTLLVVSVTFLASWLSARRAAALEPVTALRHD